MVAPRFSSQRVVSSPGATMALRVTFGSISPGVGTVMRRLSVFNARTLVRLASPTAGQLARIWASSATVARATGTVATAPSSPTTMKETVDRIKASATESDPRVRRAGYPDRASRCRRSSAGAEIEREHFPRAGGSSVRLDAKQVTTAFQPGRGGLGGHRTLRPQLETRRGRG